MNPHFLFNIFNTIQELILTENSEMAYAYTSKFSKLLRMILENAAKDKITIEHEQEFLELYLQLESLRFDDAFEYSIEVEPGIENESIPVFMVQPLVENAIRHGLLPKKGNKNIAISFSSQDSKVICEVADNGIGINDSRPEALGDNGKRSHAIHLIEQRLLAYNAGNLSVTNNSSNGGVTARIELPFA